MQHALSFAEVSPFDGTGLYWFVVGALVLTVIAGLLVTLFAIADYGVASLLGGTPLGIGAVIVALVSIMVVLFSAEDPNLNWFTRSIESWLGDQLLTTTWVGLWIGVGLFLFGLIGMIVNWLASRARRRRRRPSTIHDLVGLG